MKSISSLMKLNGRIALVTGAAGHMGEVMSDTLAELGANLVLIDLPGARLKELAERISKNWVVDVNYFHCNLEDQDQRAELISILVQKYYNLNIVINNAAFVGTSNLLGWSVPFEEQTLETWRRAIEVNLSSVFDLTKGLMPTLKRSEGSSIINISSIYGNYGPDWSLYEGTKMSNPAAYAASKGGLIQLTRWLSTTLAPEIRVNTISPGGVFRNQPEEFIQRYKQRTPLARMATEDDFRGIVAYLGSDLSSYVTGQNFMIDGGWGVW